MAIGGDRTSEAQKAVDEPVKPEGASGSVWPEGPGGPVWPEGSR